MSLRFRLPPLHNPFLYFGQIYFLDEDQVASRAGAGVGA